MEYRQHIYLILKEAINNLVEVFKRISWPGSRSVIRDSRLRMIQLEDNGTGFDTSDGLLREMVC